MWTKGQPWRVADALQKLNEQVRAYAPRSVPPATPVTAWGSIADDEHSSSSDHYPHFYSALGTIAVVCARDFPHAPALGLDGGVVTEALRISRDSRIGYLIFNRRITGPNHGWRWEDYDGSDPHDTHFHVSSVHTAAADDTRPWALPGATPNGDDDMFLRAVDAPLSGSIYLVGGGKVKSISGPEWAKVSPQTFTNVPSSLIQALLTADGPVDADQVAAALAANETFITAVANAVGAAVKDQFGPAFDERVKAAARQAVNDRLDDNATT